MMQKQPGPNPSSILARQDTDNALGPLAPWKACTLFFPTLSKLPQSVQVLLEDLPAPVPRMEKVTRLGRACCSLPTVLQPGCIPTALPSIKYSYKVSIKNNSPETKSESYREGEKLILAAEI